MKTPVHTGFVELARRNIREAIGYRSWAYRTAARMLDLGALVLSEGPGAAIRIERLKAATGQREKSVAVKFRRLKYPISLRPGSRDVETLISNVVRLEYGQLKLPTDAAHFIVDGGAYIGDTSAYFLSIYPASRILALEPNRESFDIAKRNLEPYGDRVALLHKALADKRGTLFLSGLETGAKVTATGTMAVECLTVSDLIAMSPNGRINVLKLDIEGAEEALFSNETGEWLNKVDHIIVETHGPACEKVVLGALESANWTVRRYRNLYYCSAPAVFQ